MSIIFLNLFRALRVNAALLNSDRPLVKHVSEKRCGNIQLVSTWTQRATGPVICAVAAAPFGHREVLQITCPSGSSNSRDHPNKSQREEFIKYQNWQVTANIAVKIFILFLITKYSFSPLSRRSSKCVEKWQQFLSYKWDWISPFRNSRSFCLGVLLRSPWFSLREGCWPQSFATDWCLSVAVIINLFCCFSLQGIFVQRAGIV